MHERGLESLGGPTRIDDFILEGRRKFTLYLWEPTQRVPARVYVKAAKERHPDVGLSTRIIVNRASVETGTQTRAGRTRIRYHFV
jgi:hypothetical protein